MISVNIGRVYHNVKKDIVNNYSGRKHIPRKGFEVEVGNLMNPHTSTLGSNRREIEVKNSD